jgi:hypothetical protein
MTPYELASEYIRTNPQHFRGMVELLGADDAAARIVEDSQNDPQWAGRLCVHSVRPALIDELQLFVDEDYSERIV